MDKARLKAPPLVSTELSMVAMDRISASATFINSHLGPANRCFE
jgi:hypothetical protein